MKKTGRINMEDSKITKRVVLQNGVDSILIANRDFQKGDYICMLYGKYVEQEEVVCQVMERDMYNDNYMILQDSKLTCSGDCLMTGIYKVDAFGSCLKVESPLCLAQYARDGFGNNNSEICHYEMSYHCLKATRDIKQGEEITIDKGAFYWKYECYRNVPDMELRVKIVDAYPELKETFDDIDSLFSV